MAQVNSLNVVGYQTQVPGANQFICIENPVTNTSVPNTLLNLIGSNAPVNANVFKWNYAQSKFDIFNRIPFAPYWSAPSGSGINITNVTLNVGEGFFIKGPSSFSLTFVGDVLQATPLYTSGQLTNHLNSGLWLTGNLAPDSGSLAATNTSMNFNIPVGSPANSILKWNVAGQKYDIYQRIPFGTGYSTNGVQTVPVIATGEGFFTKLSAAYDWVRNFTVQ